MAGVLPHPNPTRSGRVLQSLVLVALKMTVTKEEQPASPATFYARPAAGRSGLGIKG